MQNGWDGKSTSVKCYRQGSGPLLLIGAVLIAAGLLLLFLCIPGWAWAAFAGIVLIVAGYLLIRLSKAGR